MAKAGRPYFKRYETKIANHNVRIRRFFVRDYNVINSSQLTDITSSLDTLVLPFTRGYSRTARKHFSRIVAFCHYF